MTLETDLLKNNNIKNPAQSEEHKKKLCEKETLSALSSYAKIIKLIPEGKIQKARELLREAISEDMENPLIYNLLGISYEYDGDRLKASKFYRVAYYMDQTFKAASDNLDRVGRFSYYENYKSISWGIDIMEDKK